MSANTNNPNRPGRSPGRSGPAAGGAQGAKVQLVAWPTILFFLGLFIIFFSERVLTSDGAQRMFDLLGFALMAGMLLTLFGRRGAAHDSDERQSYGWMVIDACLVLAGAALYLLFAAKAPAVTEKLSGLFGKKYESAKDVVAVLWPTLVLLGGLPLAFIQRSLGTMTDGMGQAEKVELVRVRHSGESALSIVLVVLFCASINYVASDRNKKWDLARFRTTRPSEATRKIVANLSKPLKATLFFANPNEVRELVLPYFEDLQAAGGRLTLDVLDHALEPAKARELGASGNGMVVLGVLDEKNPNQAPTQRETINIGVTLEGSQTALSSLDGDVQKKLLQLSRPGRVAYFTTGHGERGFDTGGFFDLQKDDLRAPVGFLRTLLQNQGYEVKTLGVGQGLSNKVPGDAGLVIMAGANEKILPEEVAALSAYLNDGGHLYILLDPTAAATAQDLAPLLKIIGVKYNPTMLANDEVYAVRTQKAADKANIVSTSFSSHVSVTTLSRASGRAGVILPKSGYFERDGATPPGVQLDFTLRSMPKTYGDKNLNFTRDGDEVAQVFDLAAVANKALGDGPAGKGKKELRMALVGSADAVADLALQNRANAVLALDTIKWLMQEEAIVGETVQETDAPIFHTKDQDKIWFYGTIIAAPALVLGLGLLVVRRGQRKRQARQRRAS